MATGPRECKTYVLSASYRQDNHAPAVLPAVVLGGDEDDALSAATTAPSVVRTVSSVFRYVLDGLYLEVCIRRRGPLHQ